MLFYFVQCDIINQPGVNNRSMWKFLGLTIALQYTIVFNVTPGWCCPLHISWYIYLRFKFWYNIFDDQGEMYAWMFAIYNNLTDPYFRTYPLSSRTKKKEGSRSVPKKKITNRSGRCWVEVMALCLDEVASNKPSRLIPL